MYVTNVIWKGSFNIIYNDFRRAIQAFRDGSTIYLFIHLSIYLITFINADMGVIFVHTLFTNISLYTHAHTQQKIYSKYKKKRKGLTKE